jgi:hypothetical protein
MDKIFANILTLLMLGYYRATFHCSKIFHFALFMAIYGYFLDFLVIFSFFTLNYFRLLYVIFDYFILLLAISSYFTLSYFQVL